MKTNVLSQQSIFDIAIQSLGTAEAAFELALENDIALTKILTTGEPLVLSQASGSKQVAEYYKTKQLKPATGVTDEQFREILGEGIDFMGIEIDFIVS